MNERDGRALARANELRALKSLHKYAWLRSRDVAALHWMPGKPASKGNLQLEPVVVTASAMRMAQRTMARLRRDRMVIDMQAPDGATIYGLAEAGARRLLDQGIPAKSGKDALRRVSLSHYHHRRLANELAIVASLHGYRVSSEAEIAAGQWLGSAKGLDGKKPDVVIRDGKRVWLVEVERSRRNQPDYTKLLSWLAGLWPQTHQPARLPGDTQLQQIVFVASPAFLTHVQHDLSAVGWSAAMLSERILPLACLYVTEARYILKAQNNVAG